jgi:alpha-L-fucosidase 2
MTPHRPSAIFSVIVVSAFFSSAPDRARAADQGSTAWRNGKFEVNVKGVIGRSDIVLQKPNLRPEQEMPLGNGRLGAAVWSETGMTVQLNRADTLSQRLSPGQIVIPGLRHLVEAPDYKGRVDLYNGEFVEQGGGMKAVVYVAPERDVLVVDVTGADTNSTQTAKLYLWQPRHPKPECRNGIGLLSQTWTDSTEAGASGETFGSLSAITAQGRDVRASIDSELAVTVSFRPKADGSFRVLAAAPAWRGGDGMGPASNMLADKANLSVAQHRQWWNSFWQRAGFMKISSPDNSGEYFENLRAIDLFTAAAESLGRFPGSQAGIGNLFSSVRDEHKWGPSAYWHWNLRMQVAANLGAGLYQLNDSYFNLYRDNLANIESWTKDQMKGRAGACVPETMRFNGAGYENETWLPQPGVNCSAESKPYYNARTISTGAEVSLWIWQQYLATQNRDFLAAQYPVMAAAARFLLAYATRGADGMIHTYPSNAHESQWDVHDPTTDLAAMRSLFPVVSKAAKILHTDPDLVRELETAVSHIPAFPRVEATTPKQLLTSAAASGSDVIGPSYDPGAPIHNTENIGLEPVWPYSLIGDTGPLHDLAVRTYTHRPNRFQNDWSFDPVHAARLGLADEMKGAVKELTERYQAYPSGLATFVGPEFYVEQIGVVAAALQEALIQDYDGVLRIAPAWPADWDVDATLYIQQQSSVHVQVRHGVPQTVVIESGAAGQMRVRNPWPGEPFEIVAAQTGRRLSQGSAGNHVVEVAIEAGKAYVVQRSIAPKRKLPFASISGTPAERPKSLGSRSIGL